MLFIKTTTHPPVFPYTVEMFAIDYPDTTLAVDPDDDTLLKFGLARVTETPQPQHDQALNVAQTSAQLIDGVWTQQWTVVPCFSDPQMQAAAVQAQIVSATQKRLDDFARTREYDDMRSLVSYVNDPDPVFAAEGLYGLQVRSQTWATVRAIRDAVLAGTRPLPSGYAEIEPELPVLAWPGSNA